jgi:hypothetical protein
MAGEFSFENSVGRTGKREPKMWECPKCRESVEDDFGVCWNCGTSSTGVEDPQFAREDVPSNPASDPREAGCSVCPACGHVLPTSSPAEPEASNAWTKCGRGILGRLPRRFSLRQVFVVVTLVACFVALATQQRRVAKLQVDNARYRRELGYLEITDPSRLHAVGLPPTEDWLWQWHVYVPKDGQHFLGIAASGIPPRGLPAKVKDHYARNVGEVGYGKDGLHWNIWRFDTGADSYVILRARLARDPNGGWEVRMTASNGWRCRMGLGEETPSWLRRYCCECIREGQTVRAAPHEPLTLLRHRDMVQRKPPGVWTGPEAPCDGLMIWIDEVP